MGHRMVGLMDLVVWVHILLVSLFLGLGSATFLCCCGNFPTLCSDLVCRSALSMTLQVRTDLEYSLTYDSDYSA